MEYGCIGERLGHSFSRDIHSRLFDYNYELKEIPKDCLDEFMIKRDFKAINVTIPYKQAVIPYLDFIDDVAREIGAVNMVVNNGGRLSGYNTDYLGMKALIEKEGIILENKKVLILGSGGTSKTAFAVSRALGAAEIYRVSRSANEDCITYYTAIDKHNDAEIIINTTPSGMFPNIGQAAIDISHFKNLSGVVDAVYNPIRPKLVCDALVREIKAAGGLYMLIAQAAFAAEKFIGEAVEREKIDLIYREMIREKQNIVLIGMPGCGKTTVGKILAHQLNMKFIDTDEEIVKTAGKSITDIFAEVGESGFRDIESSVIKEISKEQTAVISTGGGAILRGENIELLRENGKIYFIDRDISEIKATSDRPLSSNSADLEKRYNERYQLYCESADIIIKSGISAEINADTVKKDFLK